MTSPPNFMSFSALNSTSRMNSPMQSPFLSPFPSSPSSPSIEPRRTRSRHMDTFSYFDAKPQSPGPQRETSGPMQSSHLPEQNTQQYQAYPMQQVFSQQSQPSINRWDAYQSSPSSPFPGSRVMTPGGSRPAMSRWLSQNDPFSSDNTPIASPNLGLLSPSLGTVVGDDGDEVIATAVVVKNIPFSLKKEALLELFDQMVLPKPYAFNYHFDNGTFRGLAFANFHSPEETQHVIRALNGYELIGRKLRVEYKKVLPADQRERIELQKRQRAVQDEPLISNATAASSASVLRGKPEKKFEVDLNDPATLHIYSSLLLFRDDTSANARTQIAFPPEYPIHQRRILQLIAQKLGLDHSSRGENEERYIVISKLEADSGSSASSQTGMTALGSLPSSGSASSTQPSSSLRIDTKQLDSPRKLYGNMHISHLQPPGFKQMKSYDNLRASSPLRTSAGALSSDYFMSPAAYSSSSPYASPVPSYPNPLVSPGVGTVVAGLNELTMNASVPSRQPKGPEPKNAFSRGSSALGGTNDWTK